MSRIGDCPLCVDPRSGPSGLVGVAQMTFDFDKLWTFWKEIDTSNGIASWTTVGSTVSWALNGLIGVVLIPGTRGAGKPYHITATWTQDIVARKCLLSTSSAASTQPSPSSSTAPETSN